MHATDTRVRKAAALRRDPIDMLASVFANMLTTREAHLRQV